MNKHTPGPWYVQDDHGKRWIETEGNDDTIAEIHRRKRKGSVYSCEEAGANADLIAAAPDLLEALEDLKRELILSDVDMDYIESHFRPWLNKAESAVAKARNYIFSPMPVIAKATQ